MVVMILQIHSFIYCALLKAVYVAPQEGCTTILT